MDRQIVWAGQIPLDTDLLNTNRNVMVGFGYGMQDTLGAATQVSGFPITATAPASLAVNIGAGRIYSVQNVDNSAFGSLAADTTDTVMKQGILLTANAPVALNCPAPSTAGYSINYLIEVAYQDSDTNLTVLPYYNASNPSQAYAGPNNSNTPQATKRQGLVSLIAKPGIAATTGTQVTPSADSGYVGLYVVTVAYGQTAITSANFVLSTQAPSPLASFSAGFNTGLLSQATANGIYQQLAGKNWSVPTPVSGVSLTVNGVAGAFAEVIYSQNTTGQSLGLQIQAGTNNTDYALNIKNASGGAVLVTVTGAGNMTVNSAGGPALTLNGAAGNYTSSIVAPNTSGQSYGLSIQGGTTTSDYALNVKNAAGNLMTFVTGTGRLGVVSQTTTGEIALSVVSGTGGSTGLYVQCATGNTSAYAASFDANGSSLAAGYFHGGTALQLFIQGASAGTPAIGLSACATTGAQTATFSATNKPGSGTTAPSKWIPFTLDGTTYYVPAWL
ncbi:MAG: hypothetical protein KGL39_41715 [Patescibacteria group bacterium]|nr:hypothetical protein [Patescibacteria group bacterium]